MLLAGLTVFGAASLVGGFTTSPAQLIAARAVMGLGAAMTFPATLSLISNVFTQRRERARAIGLWGAIAGVAIALGPIVGGWLLETSAGPASSSPWPRLRRSPSRWSAVSVPASKNPESARVDLAGLVLSAATMGLLVFTIIEAPDYGWTSVRSLLGFAVSAVLLAAFVGWERRVAYPMLDVRLFRNMRFSAASGAVTVAFFTLFGFIFLMTQYFQFVRGYGPLSTGVHLLPVALSVGAGSVAGTQLAVRMGTKLVVTAGLVAMAAFYGWVAATTTRDPRLRRHRGPDGAVRAGHGADLGTRHRVDHGRGVPAPGGCGVRGQRLDPAARRDPRRGRDRQRLRVAVRLPAHR